MNIAGCNLHEDAEFYVAIDNKGLWPNLTLLSNGEILAAIYNHPSHGMGPDSAIEIWHSSDDGKNFQYRSTATDISAYKDGIRMNHAAGINSNGEFIVLASGFHAGQKLPLLPLQTCISKDNGKTWKRYEDKNITCIPYGNILENQKGELLCSMYAMENIKNKKAFSSWLFSSDDGGKNWQKKSLICENANETFLYKTSENVFMASVRTACTNTMDSALPHGAGEKLLFSYDNCATWNEGQIVSPQGQENASILELSDGRLLYCFTSRIPGLFGIVFRISSDKGKSWSPHKPLITIPATDWHKTDCGYPSSVQIHDGTVVTAYYFGPRHPDCTDSTTPWHSKYHMGIARWHP